MLRGLKKTAIFHRPLGKCSPVGIDNAEVIPLYSPEEPSIVIEPEEHEEHEEVNREAGYGVDIYVLDSVSSFYSH